MPALTRVASRISSARLHQLPGSYWKTTSRNELDPMSITAKRSIALDDGRWGGWAFPVGGLRAEVP